MRTVSIVSIIKKYGLSSKRLNPKNRIKYEDAVKSIKGYQSAELEITDIIDNVLYPEKSKSKVCQVDGCGKKIRYEYVLRNKLTSDQIVAGSTCVWVLLGMDELQIKSFGKFEQAIKDYHALIQWKQDNPDVVEKLALAEKYNLYKFKPFWNEIKSCKLLDEDTEYIRQQDIEKIVRRQQEKQEYEEKQKSMSVTEKRAMEAEYNKVVSYLDDISRAYPSNEFYQSLVKQVKQGKKLSPKQQECVKLGANRLWYDSNIKGTAYDCWNYCEGSVLTVIKNAGYCNANVSYVKDNYSVLSDLFAHVDKLTKIAWSIFRVKYKLV